MYLVKITRKDSPYNKYIKWLAEGESEETGARFSLGFKTLKDAKVHAEKNGRIIEIKTKKSTFKNPAYN